MVCSQIAVILAVYIIQQFTPLVKNPDFAGTIQKRQKCRFFSDRYISRIMILKSLHSARFRLDCTW